jgi:hypothetical protein
MSEWEKSGRIRIDGHRFDSGAWRFTSPDYANVEVTGANIVEALQGFMEALVERFPDRAGTTSDVIIREVDLAGAPTPGGFVE